MLAIVSLVFAAIAAERAAQVGALIGTTLAIAWCALVTGTLLERSRPFLVQPAPSDQHFVVRALSWLLDPLNWFLPVRRDPLAASLEERIASKSSLAEYTSVETADVAEFLFNAIGKNVDAKHKAIETLESKAASQIGFAGTIIAIFAALGDHAHFLWVGIPLGISILASLRAVFVKSYNLPSPIVYNLESIISDAKNKGRIALELTESYNKYSLGLGVVGGRIARYVNVGAITLVIGVTILLAMALTGQPPNEPVSIKCDRPNCVIVVNKETTNGQRSGKSQSVRGASVPRNVKPQRGPRQHSASHATP